jgi:hypothetical protein
MVMEMEGASFRDLRRLADWLAATGRGAIQSAGATLGPTRLTELLTRLDTAAVPLLGRAVRDGRSRDAARHALAALASFRAAARDRVIAELVAITEDPLIGDDAKLCAVGLLAELGERGAARFADPRAARHRCALALAQQLDTPAQLARAVDLMLERLEDTEIADMVDAMAEVATPMASRVAAELCCRLDASIDLVAIVAAVAPIDTPRCHSAARRGHSAALRGPAKPDLAITRAQPRTAARPARATVLVDAAARLVVVATRRGRRWAVLIGAAGEIDSCEYAEGGDADAAPLVDALVGEGYRAATTDAAHARAIVAAAAQLTAGVRPDALASAYYLGRDLLDLGDAHMDGRPRVAVVAMTLGRAVELIAAGEHARALAVLRALGARCDTNDPDVAAATASCFVAQGCHAEALPHLVAACDADRAWPLHHWNLAASLHAVGDAEGCCVALRGFVAASETPTAVDGDPDQPARIDLARRLLAARERADRAGPHGGKRRRRRARASRQVT